MQNLIFRVAQREDYPDLAAWLVAMAQEPQQHCLHTWSGQSASELCQQLLGYLDDSELVYLTVRQDGQLTGALGCEYDEGLGRGWLHGPYVAAEDWDAIAGELYMRLLRELPASIQQLDAYLNIENLRGRRFFVERGFKEREHLSYDFWLRPEERILSGDPGCLHLGPQHETSFKQLYEALFPNAYYSAERVIDMIGGSHQVFVLAEDEEVLGFAVVSLEEGPSTGEIQFLGVRVECRRKGYGRRLLLCAIDWLLDRASVGLVCLNVAEELIHARALYESAGFRLRFTGIGLEKKGVA